MGVFIPELGLQAMVVWLLYPTFSANSPHELPPYSRPPYWVPICLQQELLSATLPSCIPLPNSEVPVPLPCTNIASLQTHLAMPPKHPQDPKALQSGLLPVPHPNYLSCWTLRNAKCSLPAQHSSVVLLWEEQDFRTAKGWGWIGGTSQWSQLLWVAEAGWSWTDGQFGLLSKILSQTNKAN